MRALTLSWHFLLGVARLAYRLVLNLLGLRGEAPAKLISRTLVEFLEAMGPTFIKFGQILSTRRDLFGEPMIQEFERLRDHLPPIPFYVVPPLFREELGVEIDDAFCEFDSSAVASASIASVYRARLHDGRAVAVKVRRPGISARIEADLRLIEAVVRLIGRLPSLRLIPLRPAIGELGACIKRQLDFRLEAAANRRLRSALVWEPGVIVPALVEELCSSSILTMDFVEDLCNPGQVVREASQKALLAALRALYRMIFVEGFVHCDLHQGNLHFLSDGRAVVIDFGFMAELLRDDRLKFAEFFYAMATNDGVRCAQIVLETAASTPPDLAYDKFEAEVAVLVERVSGANARDFQVANFVVGLFDIQRRFRIIGTTAFTMAIVSLLVFEGIAKDVDADLDFQREAHPFILRASIQPCPRESLVIDELQLDVVSLESRFYTSRGKE